MDAIVTIRYRISNVCDPNDLDADFAFEDCVRWLIADEGIIGLADDVRGEVITVEEAT